MSRAKVGVAVGLVIAIGSVAISCLADVTLLSLHEQTRPSAESLAIDPTLSCAAEISDAGFEPVALQAGAGPCFWIAADHLVLRPTSQGGWEAIADGMPGLLMEVSPPAALAPDLEIQANGTTNEVHRRVVARVDLTLARAVLSQAGARAAEPPAPSTASNESVRVLVDLAAWLTETHPENVASAAPLILAAAPASAASPPSGPCACVTAGVHDALAAPASGVDCQGGAISGGSGLLVVEAMRREAPLSGCGSEPCAPVHPRLAVSETSSWPVLCAESQLETCLGPGTALPGAAASSPSCGWAPTDGPIEQSYTHRGVHAFGNAPTDKAVQLIMWEDGACTDWWTLSVCEPDRVVGAAFVQRGDGSTQTVTLGPWELRLSTVDCLQGPETCDRVDNDCDGAIDELPLHEGAPCAGPRDARAGGTWRCVDGAMVCEGWLPRDSGDCLARAEAEVGDPCGSNKGNCKGNLGQLVCIDGVPSCHQPARLGEVCGSGVDEDCDGSTDEGECSIIPAGLGMIELPCGLDIGACQTGVKTCSVGMPGELEGDVACGPCVGAVYPADELCNDLDDDCNGTVDDACVVCEEGATEICSPPGKGPDCADSGWRACDGGAWGACHAKGSEPEVCDGADNDCDGETDESCECSPPGSTESCAPHGTNGECSAGVRVCSADGIQGPCTGAVGPTGELCDGLDNDCDGITDPAPCVCVAGEKKPCPEQLDKGECVAGWQLCEGGYWAACTGKGPTLEICDGLNNDCDEETDEENAQGCKLYYLDADGDEYGTGASRCLCAPSGDFSSLNAFDCYDGSAKAYPGQTKSFSEHRGDGSFDYNCDGLETQMETKITTCPSPNGDPGWVDSVPACGESGDMWDCCPNLPNKMYCAPHPWSQGCR